VQGKWEPSGQWRIEPATRLSPHQKLESYFSSELSGWRRWYLGQGACLFLFGLACIWAAAAPVAQPVSMEMLLILAGGVTLVSALRADQSPGLALSLPLAFIPLATGAYLLGIPREPAPNLGLVFTAYFTASGIAAILLAVAHRRRLYRQWEWLVVSGVTSLIFALLLLSGLPGPFTWMFGLILGVDFMFGGSAFIALALGPDELYSKARQRDESRDSAMVFGRTFLPPAE
jgi:uncharacterized membrane protein HdeD (DUF308 family)